MIIKEINVNDYLTKSNLPASDYVINPYVGCPMKCLYCYAAYMVSFSKHEEDWGDFIDVKHTNKRINNRGYNNNCKLHRKWNNKTSNPSNNSKSRRSKYWKNNTM